MGEVIKMITMCNILRVITKTTYKDPVLQWNPVRSTDMTTPPQHARHVLYTLYIQRIFLTILSLLLSTSHNMMTPLDLIR